MKIFRITIGCSRELVVAKNYRHAEKQGKRIIKKEWGRDIGISSIKFLGKVYK